VNFVGDDQLLECDVLGAQFFDQISGLLERHVAIVVAMNKEKGERQFAMKLQGQSVLLAPFDVSAVNCPLQFFSTNPYDVGGASFRRPAPTVINFDPVTGQTTSGKRRYPNPMLTFLHGYRCPSLREIKIQLCRLTCFDCRVVDGSLHGAIHDQCHPVIACRETFQTVMTFCICFNRREQSATVFRLYPNIRAFDRMSVSIFDDPLKYRAPAGCACDEKHGPKKTNPN
jgi:hypothetical protein